MHGLRGRRAALERVAGLLDVVGLSARRRSVSRTNSPAGSGNGCASRGRSLCSPAVDHRGRAGPPRWTFPIQAQIIKLLRDLQAELGIAYLFICTRFVVVRSVSATVSR